MTTDDVHFMRMAIEEARKCQGEDKRVHPMVGVVVVKNGQLLAKGYRGELSPGEHAEYTVLERKLEKDVLTGCTVYSTLEPCTTRNHPKVPCANRLAERKVARVVMGMLDPNPEITGRGQRNLRRANVATELFTADPMAEVEEVNRAFIRAHEKKAPASPLRSSEDRPNSNTHLQKRIDDVNSLTSPTMKNKGFSELIDLELRRGEPLLALQIIPRLSSPTMKEDSYEAVYKYYLAQGRLDDAMEVTSMMMSPTRKEAARELIRQRRLQAVDQPDK